jgi:hypothetical protein
LTTAAVNAASAVAKQDKRRIGQPFPVRVPMQHHLIVGGEHIVWVAQDVTLDRYECSNSISGQFARRPALALAPSSGARWLGDAHSASLEDRCVPDLSSWMDHSDRA